MQYTREEIIKAAYELFLEKGYGNTTTRDIAAHLNMERGHLYYYYRKKEDLFFGWYTKLLHAAYEYCRHRL